MLYRITAPHFCAGIDKRSGRVAPILAYMRRWPLDRIADYCRRRGWELEVFTDEEDLP